MDRRNVLLSGLMSALALMLPLPAGASVKIFDYGVPIDKIELVNEAFNILDGWGFDLSEKAALFGYYPYQIDSLDALRHKVLTMAVDFGNVDARGRVRFLLAIKEKLKEQYGGDLRAQSAWMRAHDLPFGPVRLHGRVPEVVHYFDLSASVRRLGGNVDMTV